MMTVIYIYSILRVKTKNQGKSYSGYYKRSLVFILSFIITPILELISIVQFMDLLSQVHDMHDSHVLITREPSQNVFVNTEQVMESILDDCQA